MKPTQAARPSMDQTLLVMAAQLAQRSTCSRRHVGALIARDGRILSSGYNGAPTGMMHCYHREDERPDQGCKIAVHAEANAIAFAARFGTMVTGATMYTQATPCMACAQLIIQSGIVRVFANEWYRDRSGARLLQDATIDVTVVAS